MADDGKAAAGVRFGSLDGARGLFALLVAAYHVPVLHSFEDAGWFRSFYFFVDFFFVLSGFVLAHAYSAALRERSAFMSFAIRRIGRLWPLHLATLAALVALETVKLALTSDGGATAAAPAFTGSRSLEALGLNLSLLHALDTYPVLSWNVPSWSISVELWSSLLFGALAILIPRRSEPIVLGALIIAALAVLADSPPLYLKAEVHLAFLRCAAGLFAGVLAYRLYLAWRLPRSLGLPLELLVVAAVVALLWLADRTAFSVLAVPLFTAAVYVFAHEHGRVSALLGARPLQALGTLSYSIYMTHFVIFAFVYAAVRVMGPRLPGIGFTDAAGSELITAGGTVTSNLFALLLLALVIPISALTYRWVEVPSRRWFNQLSVARQRAPAAAG